MNRVETGAGWTMHLGDCLEVLPTLERVDHVITDPPYSEHVHAKSRAGTRRQASDPRYEPAPGALSSGGTFYRCSFSRAAELGFDALTPETRAAAAAEFARLVERWVLVFSNVEMASDWAHDLCDVAGLDYVRTGAWVKQAATPQFTGDRPAAGFEAITIAHPKGRKRWNGGGKQGVWTHRIAGNQPRSSRERLHTTQKPLELMLALVEDFTNQGDLVLDAFAGSATTGIACLRLGRRFVGVERDGRYFDVAVGSLRAEEQGSTLSAARAGQLPLLGGTR